MFSAADITIDIGDVDHDVALITITTPIGVGEMLDRIRIEGRTMLMDRVHVDGLRPGLLGRAGINAILRKLLVEADVERLVIQGETRSTGRYVGKRPSRVVFPHGRHDREI